MPPIEKRLTVAELVGYKGQRELGNPTELHELFRRAGYKPGSQQWDQALRGAHLAYSLLVDR